MKEDEDFPFTSDGRAKYELPDEHNNSGDDSDVSEDFNDSTIPAQAAGEEPDTDGPDSLVEAKVTFAMRAPYSRQRTNSRARRRKARADYIAGRPGHHLDVAAEELHQDQELDRERQNEC